MTRLGEQFALLILLSGKRRGVPVSSFHGMQAAGVGKTSLHLAHPGGNVEGKRGAKVATGLYELSTTGMDRMGIVYRVSRLLADRGINIADMHTKATPSPESGTPIFTMKILLEIPAKISPQDLLEELNRLGEEMAIDISLRKVSG